MCWKLTKIGIERGNQPPPHSNFSTQAPVSWNRFWWGKDRTYGKSSVRISAKSLTYALRIMASGI